jgi:hypothetical protein
VDVGILLNLRVVVVNEAVRKRVGIREKSEQEEAAEESRFSTLHRTMAREIHFNAQIIPPCKYARGGITTGARPWLMCRKGFVSKESNGDKARAAYRKPPINYFEAKAPIDPLTVGRLFTVGLT